MNERGQLREPRWSHYRASGWRKEYEDLRYVYCVEDTVHDVDPEKYPKAQGFIEEQWKIVDAGLMKEHRFLDLEVLGVWEERK